VSLAADILARTEIATCWTWQGAKTPAGYGLIGRRVDGKQTMRYVHRVMYEATKGPIPTGLSIDHLCRNTLCVNPDHLEAVPIGVNILRGNGMSARHARATECKRGHAKTPENTYTDPKGTRQCRPCRQMRWARWSEAHR
jgi:hypothetical protein